MLLLGDKGDDDDDDLVRKWDNSQTLERKKKKKIKKRVMNFEILSCDVLTKKFVIKPTEGEKR